MAFHSVMTYSFFSTLRKTKECGCKKNVKYPAKQVVHLKQKLSRWYTTDYSLRNTWLGDGISVSLPCDVPWWQWILPLPCDAAQGLIPHLAQPSYSLTGSLPCNWPPCYFYILWLKMAKKLIQNKRKYIWYLSFNLYYILKDHLERWTITAKGWRHLLMPLIFETTSTWYGPNLETQRGKLSFRQKQQFLILFSLYPCNSLDVLWNVEGEILGIPLVKFT